MSISISRRKLLSSVCAAALVGAWTHGSPTSPARITLNSNAGVWLWPSGAKLGWN